MIAIKIFILIVLIIILTILTSVTLNMYTTGEKGRYLALKIWMLQVLATVLQLYTILN